MNRSLLASSIILASAIIATSAGASSHGSGGSLDGCVSKVETVRYEPVRLADGHTGRVMVVVPSQRPVPLGVHLVVLFDRSCANR